MEKEDQFINIFITLIKNYSFSIRKSDGCAVVNKSSELNNIIFAIIIKRPKVQHDVVTLEQLAKCDLNDYFIFKLFELQKIYYREIYIEAIWLLILDFKPDLKV